MENQGQKENEVVQEFINAANIDAQKAILAKKIKKVLVNISIGAIILVTIVTAVVVVNAIEKNAEQPAIESPAQEETPEEKEL
jgi:hypothetical protein